MILAATTEHMLHISDWSLRSCTIHAEMRVLGRFMGFLALDFTQKIFRLMAPQISGLNSASFF